MRLPWQRPLPPPPPPTSVEVRRRRREFAAAAEETTEFVRHALADWAVASAVCLCIILVLHICVRLAAHLGDQTVRRSSGAPHVAALLALFPQTRTVSSNAASLVGGP